MLRFSFARFGFRLHYALTRTKIEHFAFSSNASIMPRGDKIGAVFECGFQKQFEFHLLITHNIRIWRSTGRIFVDHILNDFFAIIFFKIENLKINPKLNRNPFRIGQIFRPRAFHPWQILCPVFHINAHNIKSALLQERRGQARIDATAHSNINCNF